MEELADTAFLNNDIFEICEVSTFRTEEQIIATFPTNYLTVKLTI